MTEQIEPLADSIDDAAERLGVSRVYLYRQAAAGKIAVRKAGRRTLVERAEQSRWLTSLPLKGAAA